MRPIERLFVFGGILSAIVIALAGRDSGSAAYAGAASRPAAAPKIGTVDIYVIAEKMMAASDLKKIREDIAAGWQARADIIMKDLKDMDADLAVLPQNDPKVQELLKKAQEKQQEYQKVAQERQIELERVNSQQLIDAYIKIRAAVDAYAAKQEYTHIFANREHDRSITTTTLAQTLQELLARPIIKGSQADDITKAITTELKLDP